MSAARAIESAAKALAGRMYDDLKLDPAERAAYAEEMWPSLVPNARVTVAEYLRTRFYGDGLEPRERILIRRLAAEIERAGTAGEGGGVMDIEQARRVATQGDARVRTASASEEERLTAMMRDPRYWHDRDPAFVAQVTDGFRRL